MKKMGVVFVSAFVLLSSATARPAMFDPWAGWKTVESKHFRVHYPEKIEYAGKRASSILEEIYPKVTEKLDWKPWSYTEVILTDSTDESNGFAAVLPYNWLLIYITPPHPDSSLANYDDWLRTLLIHEFTHIVHIDAYGGAWTPLRVLFQKTVAPSGVDPTWMREGVSQYDETVLTTGGRGRGSYSEMVVRASILEDDFPTIDEADGLGWRWPGYKTAYVYGVKFTHWLVDKYGEDKYLDFTKRVRKSILIGMINHQAKRVYGMTFYQLWREWKAELEGKYAEEIKAIKTKGVTGHEVAVPIGRDEQFGTFALPPDGSRIAYSVTSPHGPPKIKIYDVNTGAEEVIRKNQDALRISWSPDGRKIAYSTIGGYKRYNRFYDLWLYDFDAGHKKRAQRLTVGQRARDPEFTADGKGILFVESVDGTDELKRYDLETRAISNVIKDAPRWTRFSGPKVSPDGKYIAMSVWRPGDGWCIYRYDADGKNPLRLSKSGALVIDKDPDWTFDSAYVVYSSDETGIANLYRVPVGGGQEVQITNVLTGVFQPALHGNSDIIAQYYDSKGFKIARLDVVPMKSVKPAKKGREALKPEASGYPAVPEYLKEYNDSYEREMGKLKPRKYVAFGHSLFLPRYVLPNVAYVDDALFANLSIGGADVLRWQNWVASGTYRSDANFFGYYMRYVYDRWRPAVGFSVNNYAVNYGNMQFPAAPYSSGRLVHYFERRKTYSTFVGVPFWKMAASLAYFYEDHMADTNLEANESYLLNLGKFAGFRGEVKYGDAKIFPASISKEDGRQVRFTGSITNTALGSGEGNEQVIFAGDWREFVSLPLHNVLAFRAGGGMTWGDPLVQGTFGLGGAVGEGAFGGGGSYNYFPLRGVPVSFLSRARAMLFSGEYRFPILSPQHGLGTIPLYMKELSGSVFADYGNAWNAHEAGSDSLSDFFDRFLLGVGSELRGDFILGHGLPVHGRVGYSIIVMNRQRLTGYTDPITGASLKNGFFILTLGSSF